MQQLLTVRGLSGNQNNMLKSKVCSLPWNHVRMHVNGDILPCCNYDSQLSMAEPPRISDGIDSAFSSELFNNLRERMLAGDDIPECRACYDVEDSGGTSLRQEFSAQFDKHIGDKKIRYIETALSTHCNLTCRMCNEDYSSKWKLLKSPDQTVDVTVDNHDIAHYNGDLSDLTLIKLVGGEPMIDKNHVPFLESLFNKSSDPAKIQLTYHTNATVRPHERVVNFWKQCKQVEIVFSIDGVGDVNEILRPPHSWNTVLHTIEYFKSIEGVNFNFMLHCVISTPNVKHIGDVIQFSFGTFDKMPQFDFLTHPEHLSLQHLDNNTKNDIVTFVKDNYLPMDPSVQSLIDFIETTTNNKFSIDDVIRIENTSLVSGSIKSLL